MDNFRIFYELLHNYCGGAKLKSTKNVLYATIKLNKVKKNKQMSKSKYLYRQGDTSGHKMFVWPIIQEMTNQLKK